MAEGNGAMARGVHLQLPSFPLGRIRDKTKEDLGEAGHGMLHCTMMVSEVQ